MNKYPNHILFTGAGFSNNWGGFLAKDMWTEIFNNGKIQKEKKLRERLLSEFDYESIYSEVMNRDEWTKNEKEALGIAIEDAYLNLDNKIVSNSSSSKTTEIINSLLTYFIPAEGKDRKGVFFTINQDLLVERKLGINTSLLGFPEASDANNIFTIQSKKLENKYFIKLPEKDEIIPFEKENRNKCFYIKLHGSQNWKDSNNNNLMIIGRGKPAIISEIPILKYYSDFFNNVLSEGNKKLLIIGYGFKDEHINKIISIAVKNNNLRVYVISPETIESFQSMLVNNYTIYKGLHGYLPYKLFDVIQQNYLRRQGEITTYEKFMNNFVME